MREVSKTNRILSLVLCVCMVLSMVPGYVLPVQAEGADSVCTCESSDPNGHAPFCDLYIAPENPACYCVAKCNEGNTNEYCDVCYFAPDACAASGEEDAALYASSYNYITSLTVGYSSKSASTAKEYASKDSHTVIDVDLNMDAGGDYVYMGYKTSSSPSNAITGIIFDDSGSESITYNGTTFYVLGGSKEPNASGDGKVDLNRDAKGAYIYVYITRDPGYDLPLTDITIGTAQETDIWWEPGCNRDNGKVQDLNQDTGDTPIYLYYNTKYTVAYECHYLKADGSTGKKSGEKQIYELNGTASYLPDVNDNPTGTAQKITSIPEHITYNGESYTFVGLREDNTVDSPTYYYLPEGYGGFQSKPTFTIKDTTRVFRAVYIHSEIRIKYNPNGGTITSGTNTGINSYWLLAGSNGVLGGYLDYTVWDMASRIKAPENKCAFLGWRIDNTGTTYNGGDKVNLTKDTTFYARWSDHILINNVCTSCGYSKAVPSLVNGVYQIGNKAELIWFAQYVNKGNTGANAKLTADIDMSGYNWTPIASTALYHSTTSYPNKGYTGTFDGNYHSISNLTIQAVSGDPDASYGLFGTLSGTVKNLGMKNFKFTGAGMDTRVGTVVGQMLSGALVENCYANTGNINTKVNTTNGVAGGIAGCNYGGTIRGCLLLNYTFNAGRHSGIVGDNRGDISSSDRKGTVVNCVTDYSTIQSKDRTGTVTNSLSGLNDTRLASGEAAWTLNGNSSSGVWKQTVGTGVPAFTGKTVYYGYLSCAADAAMAYTNDSSASTTKPDHSWADADCDTPKTCKICGKTEGNALGHDWKAADCNTPKTCKICGKTEGNALGHSYTNGFCTVCGRYQPATGSGTESNPYKIGNAGQLYWFADQVNSGKTSAWAELTADIVVNENVLKADGTLNEGTYRSWTPIGNNESSYSGIFDGKGYAVSGLYFNDSNSSFVGLFGYVDGTVQNVGVVDSYLSGSDYIGGVVGCTNGGTVSNCYNTGTVSGSSNYVGGVMGYNNNTVTDCYNTGTVIGNWRVGGVVGRNNGTVTGCYHTGTVSGNERVGGVVGWNTGTVTGCYNNGTVSASTDGGGVVGWSMGTVTGCYNTGVVSGRNLAGGVVDNNYGGTVIGCYNTGTVSGGCVGGVLGRIEDSTVTNCYYDSTVCSADAIGRDYGGTVTDVMGKTTEQFASGEVAYLLQGEQTEQVWGQNIDGEGEKDAYPVFSDAKVYQIINCNNELVGYSNTEGKDVIHSYTNGFCTVCDSYEPATGSGTESDPYKIGNAGQLYWFADQVNSGLITACAELTAHIVVNENVLNADGTLNEGTYRSWTPIGILYPQYNDTFDGKGYTVSGLYFNDSKSRYVGLFGSVSGGTVQNVGVVDSYLSGEDYVGGVVGYTNGGTVINCYNTGTVSGSSDVGGVVGHNRGGTVIDCYNTGTVSGEDDVGGVVGYINGGTVINCYHTGTVSGSNFIGGVVGFNSVSSTVTNCYHTGTVSGAWCVGGVVGYIDSSSSVTNCYYDSTVYNGDAVDKNGGGIVTDVMGKTTEQFASGEVAYLLSLGCTVGEGEDAVTYPGDIWGQNIDGVGEKDAYPVFSDAKVYQILNCVAAPAGYSNTEGVALGHDWTDAGCDAPKTCKICGATEGNTLDHSYTNGFCTGCDGYEPATGSGTESDPYKIGNAGQLYWFADQVNSGNTSAWAELTADIVVNENVLNADGTLNEGTYRSWTPIGNNESGYSGIFDGKGYTVSGVYFNYGPVKYIGLFGYVYSGTVQNVGVVHSFLFAERSVGGVVGGNYGTVINCYNTGTVSGRGSVGGVVGSNYGTVTNCYNTGTVSGRDSVGGVVGYNNGGIVTNCYYDSTVYNGDAVGENNGTVTDVMGKTTEQFASGEVAYLLSLGSTVGEGEDAVTYPGNIWGQNIDGEGEKDAYPVFSDAKVYRIINCKNEPVGYSNTESDALVHNFSGSTVCNNCGINAVVSVTIGGTTTHYLTMDDAFKVVTGCTAEDAAVMTILQDINLGFVYTEFQSGVFTVDLNGHIISNMYIYDIMTLRGSAVNVTITDSGEGGGIEGFRSAFNVLKGASLTISGGSIYGDYRDIAADESSSVKLVLAEGKTQGATFPGGITVERTTLNAILGEGAAYRQNGSIVVIADDATELLGDVTIGLGCVHEWIDATCVAPAYCSICKKEYGTTNPENHASDEFVYESISKYKHIVKHACCQMQDGFGRFHYYDETTGKCVCGYEKPESYKVQWVVYDPYTGEDVGYTADVEFGADFHVPSGFDMYAEYTLVGWFTQPNGQGTQFVSGKLDTRENRTYYAHFVLDGNNGSYMIKVHCNSDDPDVLTKFTVSAPGQSLDSIAGIMAALVANDSYGITKKGHTYQGVVFYTDETHTTQYTGSYVPDDCKICVYLLWKCDNLEFVPAADSTCKVEGNVAHYQCACGKVYADAEGTQELADPSIPVNPDAHTKQIVPAKTPTCAEAGWDAYEYCTECDYTTKVEITVDHQLTQVEAQDATCTEAGWEAYEYCTECDYTTKVEIPATGNHVDADNSGRCDVCNCLMQPAKLCMASISMNGNIAINYYMLLSDEVLEDETAYMEFTMADGEIIKIPVSQGIKAEYNGETYYAFSCAVNAKEMTDDVVCQFFYEGGSTAPFTYNVQTYANNILKNSQNEDMKALVKAMLHYGAASQIHFGYRTDDLANAGLEAPDYSTVTIEGFTATGGQGTENVKFYSASLILKSETTLRFFFDGQITATYNGQNLEVKQRSGLYYVDVIGIAAKDLDEDVTITINDGTNTAEVSFNPMSYCQGVLNDTTGAFDQDTKDVVAALYLYNQAANIYFKEY